MCQSTAPTTPVCYRLDTTPTAEGAPLGSSSRAGLASFLAFVRQLGVESTLRARVHLPVQERRTGFTHAQKSLALLAALAAGCRRARDSDFILSPDPAAATAAGLPRWPHSSQLTRHLAAFAPQHVAALRSAFEEVTATQAVTRRRLRQRQQVVIDLDQTPIPANGRTYQRTARGHFKKKGERGYQATAAFAGDTGGGDDEVLAIFLDPGNTHASHRFGDALAALARVLGPLERLPGLVLRFDCQFATADDLALLLRRGIRFVARVYADATAAVWARERATSLPWIELSPIKWVAELGEGPVAVTRPDLVCRRVLVRATGARHRLGYTAIVTNVPLAELPTTEVEPVYEARQTIEGWLSEAGAALQLKGLWSRQFAGVEAFLLHAALASNLLNWWARREVPPTDDQAPLGLRQLIGRVIAIPARVLRTAEGQLTLLLPPGHPYAPRLARDPLTFQLALPFVHLSPCDAHF